MTVERFAPLTDTIGFINCGAENAASAFCAWQAPLQAARGVELAVSPVSGDIQAAISKLSPLTGVETRRYLFTSTVSDWTAFVDNSIEGTDVFAVLPYLAEKLNCLAVRVSYIAEDRKDKYPATVLEIFDHGCSEFLGIARSISVSYDGYKWSFSKAGAVQDFERGDRYQERNIRDRFNKNKLARYLFMMGIDFFAEEFYRPTNQSGVLIEKKGPLVAGAGNCVPTNFCNA